MNQPVKHGLDYGGVSATHAWPSSNYCAVATWNSWLRLYDLGRGEFVQEFNLPPDMGGMSAAVSHDDRFLYVGTWYAWGLACVEIATRRFVWKRTDLKRFRGLCFSPKDDCLYAEFDRAPAMKIDGRTGETVTKLPRVSEVSVSPYGDYLLTCEPKHLCLRDTSGSVLQKWPREGFAVHRVGWSPRTVAIVECEDLLTLKEKFGTRAYDLRTGALLWRLPRKETFPLGIMFRPESEYVAMEHNLGADVIVRLNEQTGAIRRQTVPIANLKCKTCGRGIFRCSVCKGGSLVFAIDQFTHEPHVFPLGDYVEDVHEAQPDASPAGGPGSPSGNLRVTEGPPSVS